jgi:hypothetical protein
VELGTVLPEQIEVLRARGEYTVWVEVLCHELVKSDMGRGPTTVVKTAVQPVLVTVRVVVVRITPTTSVVVHAEKSTNDPTETATTTSAAIAATLLSW